MCEYKEDMNIALSLMRTLESGLMRMVLYEMFLGLPKVIWLLLYFGVFNLLV